MVRPVPKSSSDSRHPLLGDPLEHGQRTGEMLGHEVLADLERELVRRQPRPRQRLRDPAGEGRVEQLMLRHVDAHPHLAAAGMEVVPVHRLRARLAQHDVADAPQEPGLFGDRQEVAGKEEPVLGVVPPHERFEGVEPLGVGVDHRLVVHHDLVVEGRAERLLDAKPRHQLVAHVAVEDRHALARPFRLVHRCVGGRAPCPRPSRPRLAWGPTRRRRCSWPPAADRRRR